jgi:1,4-alpha-glucan branching enzyme
VSARISGFFHAILALGLSAACGSSQDPSGEPVGPAAPTGGAGTVGTATPTADAAAPVTLGWPPAYLSQPVLGATVYEGGTEFRVWAPHASGVQVTGEFGGPHDLVAEADGRFAAKVKGARAGQRYHYTIAHGADRLDRIDPRSRQITSDFSESIIVDPRTYSWKTPRKVLGPAREQVIYELHVRSFASPDGVAPGTFASAIGKLDSLKALGVTAIELMPVTQFGGSGWGYSVLNHFAPHAAYGTPDDLRRFVDEAHARGIGVIVDVVFNHYSSSHAGLWCFDGECPQGSDGIYFYSDPKQMTPWGPKPTFQEPAVRSLIRDSIMSLIEEYRVDGFRWDSVSNIRAIDGSPAIPEGRTLLRAINDEIHAKYPGVLSIAEDLKTDATVTSRAADGLAFDSQWDPRFYGPMMTDLVQGPAQMGEVEYAVATLYDASATTRVVYSESHDVAGHGGRIPNRADATNPTSVSARKHAMLDVGLALVTPGIPMLFEGQEWADDSDFGNKAMLLPWQDAASRSGLVQYTRDAILLRRNTGGHTRGLLGSNTAVFHKNDAAKVIAFRRSDSGGPGDDVVVVANFGATAFPSYVIGLPSSGTWHVRLNGDSKVYASDLGGASSADVEASAMARDGLPFQGSVALGPFSLVVLSQ